MWSTTQIEQDSNPQHLSYYDDTLYWLVDDEAAEPTEDELGREVPRRKLMACSIGGDKLEGDRVRSIAGALPPSQALAVGPAGAFVWGPGRECVLRVSHGGEVGEFTRTPEQPDGRLVHAGMRLFFVGKLNPATTGVAVYDPDGDDFRRVLETGDALMSSLDRVHVASDSVWLLVHDPRGWVLEEVNLAGEIEQEHLVSEEAHLFRRMCRDSAGFLLADDHGLYLFDGDDGLQRLVECELPPEEVACVADQAVWLSGAVEDTEGNLAEPWRIHAAAMDENTSSRIIFDAPTRLVGLIGGTWGCACMIRDTPIGVAATPGGHVSQGIAVLRRER
ncbi:MAG: hypothetical protein ACOC9W_04580 [Persicimonas sp.]